MASNTGTSSIEFRILGPVSLTGPQGNPLHSILARPKLVALLSRLTAGDPGSFVRRDTLIGLLWPALEQSRARSALRQSLYHLRRSLGDDAILRRGDEEVAVDPEVVRCDAAALQVFLASGDVEAGLELYRGDLLEGFFLPGAPEFETWLEDLRSALRSDTSEAAIRLAEERRGTGDGSATHWARRCMQMAPLDEKQFRRVLSVLIAEGDRVGAVREFEAFRARLRERLDLEPGPETLSLIQDLRSPGRGSPTVPASGPTASGAIDGAGPRDSVGDVETRSRQTAPGRAAAVVAARPRAFRIGLLIGALGVLAVFAVQAFRRGSDPPLDRSRILVAGFVNATGDSTFDGAAAMVADWVTRGLEETGLMDVVVLAGEGPGPTDPESTEGAVSLAESAGAGIAVSGSLYAIGDSLRIEARIIDVASRKHLAAVEPVSATLTDPLQAVEETRQRVAGALAVILDLRIAVFADARRQPPTFEAYREFIDGETEYNRAFDRSASASFLEAREHFLRAYALDTTFKAALLRAAWSSYAGVQGSTADSLARLVLPHRERLTPHARARLDMLVAMLDGDRMSALRASRLLTSAPLDRAMRALEANRPAEAREALLAAADYARGLGESGYYGIEVAYWHLLANAHHRLGDHEAELAAARAGRTTYPNEVLLAAVEFRALAALGRVQELEEQVEAGRGLPRARTPWLGGGIWRAAGELAAHGHPAEGVALGNRAVQWYLDLPEAERSLPGATNGLAKSYYVARRWEEADSAFRALSAAREGDYNSIGYRAVIAARRGDRDAAESLLEQLADLADPYDRGRVAYWGACVAAQLGDRELAMDRLLQSFREGRSYDLLLHADMDLEPLRSDPRFHALMKPGG